MGVRLHCQGRWVLRDQVLWFWLDRSCIRVQRTICACNMSTSLRVWLILDHQVTGLPQSVLRGRDGRLFGED